jgi:N-carbamoyl-L-amino-acid hydrolase
LSGSIGAPSGALRKVKTMSQAASSHVDEARLWARHMEFAALGATPRGGVGGRARGRNHKEARRPPGGWAKGLGFTAFLDPIGNLFLRREGTDATAEPILSGSHTDTQPSGGKFDGIYGVLAACEALEAIHRAGLKTRRPLEAVVWTCEEGGARFPIGTMGSSAFTGLKKMASILDATDDAGVTVRHALDETRAGLAGIGMRPLGFPVAGFVEAHIEQGPELEARGLTIGVVTGIQGARRFLVEVQGEDAHAGTTTRARRKDALSAAVKMVAALEGLFHDAEDTVRFTVGRFRIKPDAPAVVPGYAQFTIDFRHPEEAVLKKLGDQVEPICRLHAGKCELTVTETSRSAPVPFTTNVPDLIDTAAGQLGFKKMRILSGAGHDAMHLAKVCPTGMIFVPCERGVSHNETENATAADLAAGTRVLADVLVEMANR